MNFILELSRLQKQVTRLLGEVGKIIATKTREEWLELAAKHSIPMAPSSAYADILDPENTVGKHFYYLLSTTFACLYGAHLRGSPG